MERSFLDPENQKLAENAFLERVRLGGTTYCLVTGKICPFRAKADVLRLCPAACRAVAFNLFFIYLEHKTPAQVCKNSRSVRN